VEINQVYKAPSLPKIGRRNINSPLNRGALGSGITAKKSTFSFNKVAPKLTSAKLNTDTDKSKESFNSIKPFKSNLDIVDVLKESNKLLYEIREQLSLDYNERIKEREENLRLAKKRITANKISEKEKKIESRGKSLIGRALNTVIAPAKSIFQRILDFLSIIITGIVLNTAFNWLSKKENQEKLEKFFNFLGDYWKELLVVFGAFKILRLVQKISKIGKGLKSLFNGFKGTGGSARVTTGVAKQGGKIGKGLRSLLNGFKGRRNVTGGSNAFTRNLSKLKPFNFNVSKGSNAFTRNLSKLKPFNFNVSKGSNQVAKQGGKKVLKEFFKNLPIKAPALSFAIDMATGESMDRALAGLAGASAGATYGAIAFAPIPILGARVVGAILGAIIGEAGMKEIASAMSAVGKLKSDNIAAADNAKREALAAGATDKKMTPGDIEALISGTRIKDAGGDNIPDMYNDPLGLRRDPTGMGAFSQGGTVPLNRGGIVDNPKPKGYSEGGSIFERIKGTVGGIGSGVQDTVKALLAPGEEVIKTSSANLFRPLLKDINDNAGRLWRQFAESTIIQDKNNKKSEKMNLVFRKLLTEFTELFDKEKREIEKRKRKARRRQPVDPPGGGSPGLSSSRKSPLTSIGKISNSKNTSSPMSTMRSIETGSDLSIKSGKISNSKNTSSPMSTMRSSGKISNSKNTSSPTSPSSLRNTNKVTPQISSTPQSVNKMSNKTPLQAVEIVPFPINNSEKQLESNISTPTPTINIQNIENSPTTMTVGPLVIEKNSGAPSVNVVNLAPKVLDLSKKSTPKPSVTDSDAAPIPSISPFDSNNDFNYTVPETLGILV